MFENDDEEFSSNTEYENNDEKFSRCENVAWSNHTSYRTLSYCVASPLLIYVDEVKVINHGIRNLPLLNNYEHCLMMISSACRQLSVISDDDRYEMYEGKCLPTRGGQLFFAHRS